MNKKSARYFKCAGQNKRAGGNFFLKINKRADQNKAVQGGICSQNARLFGTLE